MSVKELIADIYPLSPMQEGMLFHSLYAPESGVYFLQTICSLVGEVEPELLERAWNRALKRHDILRTAFLWENLEQPVQVVYRTAPVTLEVLDFGSDDDGIRKRRRFLEDDRRRGFDPSQPPLLRLTLIRLDDHRRELVFSYHHLLLDAWSGPPLLGEVFAEYRALCRGEDFELPRRRPYRDYIAWLRSADPSAAEGFWRRRLAGFQAPTPLPADRPASDLPTPPDAYGTRQRRTSEELTEALEKLGRRSRVTLNVLTQSIWALLLSRWSGEREVLFGMVTAGRPTDLPGAESMIGLFINTLPVRVRPARGESTAELFGRLQQEQVEIQRHEQTPLVRIQGWSEVPHGQPLFDSISIFANYPSDLGGSEAGSHDDGVQIEKIETVERTHFPLTVEARVDRDPTPVLELQIYYERERFDATTVARFLEQMEVALTSLAAAPDRPIETLQILTPAAHHQLTVEWAARRRSRESTLIELFHRRNELGPEATAATDGEKWLSYGELRRRARELADMLRAAGVGPEVRVALSLERSLEMLVAIVGVLEAGGAYVPLAPDLPPRRMRFVLQEISPPVIVKDADRHLAEGDRGTAVLSLDSRGRAVDGRASRAGVREVALEPDHPAYVIYTSGSTGRPKGTVVTHGNAARLFLATEPWFDFGAEDIWTLFHSYAFDFSVWEIWGAFLYGGRVVVVPDDVARSPDAFRELLAAERVTVLNQTPSAFRSLARAEGERKERLSALQWVIFGGEAVDLPSLRPWFERYGDQRPRLINMYGITETTVHVTYRPLRVADLDGPVRGPVGRPIPDLDVHVFNRWGRAPIGVSGELQVGGAGLARGYLGHPEMTAERLVPHSSGASGERLYRTGDLGRRTAAGELEHLGRIDHQVKIRGFRIELGEIEAVLGEHEAVAAAAVTADSSAGETRLVGYLVLGNGKGASAISEVRRFLRRRLPEYMMPAHFVLLEEMPLTSTGKLDRRALPLPDGERPELETEFVAPRNELERKIATVWCQVLGIDRVGVHDNFFDVGGHSLAMVQVVGKLRRALDREIAVIEAFQHPTVHQLAARWSAGDQGPSPEETRALLARQVDRGKDRRRQRLERQRLERQRRGLGGKP